jgi:hypothetical protein
LRTHFGLFDQDKLFTGASTEENVSRELIRSPASELAAIEPCKAAAFYSHPQETVFVLTYAEDRRGG